jgi:DNA-binding Lrp family transcriptional regulator
VIVDKTDVILCQLLLVNSRLSYRELGKKLNLSVTAVHNRIQSLIQLGVIRKFNAKLSLLAKNGIHILVFGFSKANSVRDLNPKLEKNGSIYWLALGGGNIFYIGAYLKNIAELEGLVRFVKEAAQIPEPTVGITAFPIPPFVKMGVNPKTKLCELDYKIVRSLKDNSRKPTSEIAEELCVSAKTVRRRLTRMINNYLVLLSIDWYPDASNDIISAFHVQLRPEADHDTANVIWQRHYPNAMFYWGFSNLPNTYLFLAWTPTAKELRDMRESLENEPAVEAVTPNILYTGYIFPTWLDTIP